MQPDQSQAVPPVVLVQTPAVQTVDCREFDEATIHLFLAPGVSPYADTEEFLLDCEMRADEMPRFVRRALLEFQVRSNSAGILLLRGLPIDPGLYHVNTPANAQRSAQKTTFVSERCLAMVGSRLGHLVSYYPGEKRRPVSESSAAEEPGENPVFRRLAATAPVSSRDCVSPLRPRIFAAVLSAA